MRALAGRIVDAWAGVRRRPRPGPAQGVLIVAAGGLGDTVLFAHVAPRLLRLARQGEPVSVLLRADAARMAFLLPPGVDVIAVDFTRLRRDARYRLATLDQLYRAHFRLVVSADHLRHPDLDEALIRACAADEAIAMEARASAKHGRRLGENRALYARLFDSGPALTDKVMRWWAFADWLLGETPPPAPLAIPAERLPAPANLEAPTVVIQPFSAVPAKQSPARLYEGLIAALPAGHRVLITGTPGDLARNPEYRALLELPGVAFDASSFEALVPILRAARLVVSVDTALMHLAAAVGAPTLGLASAAFVGEIVPYASAIAPANLEVIHVPMACQGCLGACIHPLEAGRWRCVARLDEAAVVARALGRLAQERPA